MKPLTPFDVVTIALCVIATVAGLVYLIRNK